MDTSLLPLAYLLPIGLLLIAWSSTPTDRLRESALAACVSMLASVAAYLSFGFALQFGGIGLSPNAPAGVLGLDRAWTPFSAAAGRWSLIGLEGFFGDAEGSAASLALVPTLLWHRFPMAMSAGLIPVLTLGDRVNRIASIAAGIVSAALVFPIAGAWTWGGGWLALLGVTLHFGHGAIDPAGSGTVFLASSVVALIALRFFDAQSLPASAMSRQAPLAPIGTLLFGVGWSAWTIGDPLLSGYSSAGFGGAAAIGLISALTAGAVSALHLWLVSGRIRLFEAAPAWAAGWIAASASALFIPPAAAVIVGGVAGVVFIWSQHRVERMWGLRDRAGSLVASGLVGVWGLIAPGLFADGIFGAGWNGVTLSGGVRGLLASDPGQLTAQLAALVAIVTCAVCAATLLLLPLSTVTRRTGHKLRTSAAHAAAGREAARSLAASQEDSSLRSE